MRQFWQLILVFLLGIGLLLGGLPAAYGQETGEEAQEEAATQEEEDKDVFVLEEITVTATKRETNLMYTPGGIGAVTDDLVTEIGAQEMSEVFRNRSHRLESR